MTTPQTPVSREQQVIETFVRKYFDDDDVLFIVNNDWNYQFRKFTESDEYRSIPPATDDLREKIEKTIIDNKKYGWDYLSSLQLENLLKPTP